jgi:hypothetical protein
LGGLCQKLEEAVVEEEHLPARTPDTAAAQELLSCYQQCLLVMRRMFDCHEWELTAVKHVFRTLLHALCEQQHQLQQREKHGGVTASRQDSHKPPVAPGVTNGVTPGTQVPLLGPAGPVGLMLPPLAPTMLPAAAAAAAAAAAEPTPAAAAAAKADVRSAGCALVLQQQPALLAAVRQVQLQTKLAGVTREGVTLAAQDLLQDLTSALQLANDTTAAAAAGVAPTPPPLPAAAAARGEGGRVDKMVL